MLHCLTLKDFVIVDGAELELGSGLTALTGETGAGKSIVVDALVLIAGGRAGSDLVRQGAERAEVTAAFAPLPAAARAWLDAQSIDHEDEVLVRRVIGADGRTRAYVNGQLVPVQMLRELADALIEIHGQQEFQRLVSRGAQRDTLDAQLEDPALPARVRSLYERHRVLRDELAALRSAAQSRDARLDLLRYQLTELDAEVSTPEAIDALFLEQKRISSRGRLAEAVGVALEALYEREEASAHDLLGRAGNALKSVTDTDRSLEESAALVAQAAICAREAADALRRYLEALAMDPGHQEKIERQAAAVESLARKHRVPPSELPAQAARLRAELERLTHAGESLQHLEQELARIGEEYAHEAGHLSAARRRAGAQLAERITELMQVLGMKGGRFVIGIEPAADPVGPHGADAIEFLVSANPGVPPKSLARVASGGELSRLSLAVQVAVSAAAQAPCMVFDEVDAGIGGGTAEIVGRQLRALGERTQVLCVTHLPQVAAQAHHQLKVSKRTEGGRVRTVVEPLSATLRVDELARMLGGVHITEQARAHAREMLAQPAGAAMNGGARPAKAREPDTASARGEARERNAAPRRKRAPAPRR
jgi:DNA repair protein RecN (Recombination protein N)